MADDNNSATEAQTAATTDPSIEKPTGGDSGADNTTASGLLTGPKPGVKYPLTVTYCGECGMPPEYCQYGPSPKKCLLWLQKNLPDMFEKLAVTTTAKKETSTDKPAAPKLPDFPSLSEAAKIDDSAVQEAEEKRSRQKRGGKGQPKQKKSSTKKICISRANRGKKKFVTVITGLGTYDIELKDAAKYFASKFACGSSVTGADEIVIQGDVKDDLIDLITEKWPQIDEDTVEDLGDKSR